MTLLDALMTPDFLLALAIAVVSAVGGTAVIALVLRRLGRRHAWADDLIRRCRRPFRVFVLVLAIWIAVVVTVPDDSMPWLLSFSFRVVLFASAAWFVASMLYYAEDLGMRRYRVDVADNRLARRARTQMRILRRIGVVVVGICAAGALLLSIPGAAAAGASLFASAGLVSVVAGLAAQSTLANVFAGMQLAFNDALRVDDVVIVEEEWGKVEEITLTYIVVRLWDDRRMVLPSTYFTTQPFQNWTRRTSELLGAVELDVDWRVSPSRVREELDRILAGTELWDGRTAVLQVTDATGGKVRVRILVSAADAPTLFDLRCMVRENVVEWLAADHAAALPVQRLETGRPRTSSDQPRRDRDVVEAKGLFTGDEGAQRRAQAFTDSVPTVRQEPAGARS